MQSLFNTEFYIIVSDVFTVIQLHAVICLKHGYVIAQLLVTRLLHRHSYCVAHGYCVDTVILLKHGYCVEHAYSLEAQHYGLSSAWLRLGLGRLSLAWHGSCGLLHRHGYSVDTVIAQTRLLHRHGFLLCTVICLNTATWQKHGYLIARFQFTVIWLEYGYLVHGLLHNLL